MPHQQRVTAVFGQWQFYRQRNADGVARSRGATDGTAVGGFNGVELEIEIALRSNQLHNVMAFKAVFHRHRQPAVLVIDSSDLADKLLVGVAGRALGVVLVFLWHMAAVKTFGVTAVAR